MGEHPFAPDTVAALAQIGRETWEVVVRRGEAVRDLVVRLAWDLRLPVDAAELLASEVLVRLGAPPAEGSSAP
jgi:hypothetical protein